MIDELLLPGLTLLQETGAAVFAGLVGSAATVAWVKGQSAIRFRRLRKAFGRSISSHKDIMLSVPLWLGLTAPRSTHRYARRSFDGSEEVHHGPDEMFNRNDMFAAASIINLFGDFFSKPIVYVNDRDEPNWAKSSVIIIGAPVANFHARRLLGALTPEQRDRLPLFEAVPEDDKTGAKSRILVTISGREFSSNSQKDFGAVLRLSNPYSPLESYIYIVAGIHAESTQEAARLLRDEWRLFCGSGNEKAFVFEMDRGRPMTGRIVHTIGM